MDSILGPRLDLDLGEHRLDCGAHGTSIQCHTRTTQQACLIGIDDGLAEVAVRLMLVEAELRLLHLCRDELLHQLSLGVDATTEEPVEL